MVNSINAEVAAMSTAAITAEATLYASDPNRLEGLVLRFDSNGNLVSGGDPRIIDLPEHMKEAIVSFAREQFTRGFGTMNWQDGDRLGAIYRRILTQIPVQDRAAAHYTLGNIWRTETMRIQNAVQQAMPNWIHGQPVPDDILSPILRGEVGFNALV